MHTTWRAKDGSDSWPDTELLVTLARGDIKPSSCDQSDAKVTIPEPRGSRCSASQIPSAEWGLWPSVFIRPVLVGTWASSCGSPFTLVQENMWGCFGEDGKREKARTIQTEERARKGGSEVMVT